MPVPLFQLPLRHYWQITLKSATRDVDLLPRSAITNPGLGGQVERIVAQHSIEIADLQPQNKHEHVNGGWLKVTIPFTGDAKSLDLSPSRNTVPPHAVELTEYAMTLRVRDDHLAITEIDGFVSIVTQNLDLLRSEYGQLKPELKQKVEQAAEQRRLKVVAEDARDVTGTEASSKGTTAFGKGPVSTAKSHSRAQARKEPAMDEMEVRTRCFMDGIDWQHHLGDDSNGTLLFPDEESLLEGKTCLAKGGGCGIVEVEVRLVRWVRPQTI
jgi:hypothetical protein